MAVLVWGASGERYFEAGVDRGVFYPKTGTPEVWNGLVSVTENVSGGDVLPLYFETRKVYDFIQGEDFSAEIEAISYPAGFLACDGLRTIAPGLMATNQPRTTFGFSFRTRIGSDTKGDGAGYKIHIVWNAVAAPVARSYKTMGQNAEPQLNSWSISAVPPVATTYKPTSHLVINSMGLTAAKLTAVENLLYGTSSTNPALPTQAELIALLVAP